LKVNAPKLTEVKEKQGDGDFSLLLREIWETLHLPREVNWYNGAEEEEMPYAPVDEEPTYMGE
jgi:hypothetical protein